MSLTATELGRVAAELGLLAGSRVQKCFVPDTAVVALELRRPGTTVVLLVDVGAGTGRAVIVANRPPNPEKPFALQGLLRAQLSSARVDAVVVDPARRVVQVKLSTDRGPRTFVAEVTASGGLVAFLGEREQVLGGSPNDRLRARGLKPGDRWTPPAAGAVDGKDRFKTIAPDDHFALSAAIEAHYGARISQQTVVSAGAAVARSLKSALNRVERTITKVREDRARMDGAEDSARLGDLLKTRLSAVKRGDTVVVVTEWTADGPVEVSVALQPALSPRENLERYYNLHRRLTRGRPIVEARLATLEGQAIAIRDLLARARSVTSEEEALFLETRAREAGLLRATAAGMTKPGAPERLPYKAFRSSTGHPIWVGRNSRDNDALTFKVARGNDLWLHARGRTGSHVVVPGVGAAGPDGETLLDAATLAAHFSSGRDELVVDVGVTRRKYVQKPRDAPAGAVRYTQDKNVAVRIESDRLQRLLATEGVAG